MVAGYVESFDKQTGIIKVKTSGEQQYDVLLTPAAYAKISQNLGEDYRDCTGDLANMLTPGAFVYTYGISYPEGQGAKLEAKALVFPQDASKQFRHEEPEWWINQIRSIASTYARWQFNAPEEPVDYLKYRTSLHINGQKKDDNMQEIDTISRMVYGMASAYMLTGEDLFLECAEKGTDYLRDQAKNTAPDGKSAYWCHGLRVTNNGVEQVVASEFSDDYGAIPAYEQIYALAGPIQTFRITGDPRILEDTEKTISLFDEYLKDNDQEGYYSHLDPATFEAKNEELASRNNSGKKNWNSVGDHAPAYLVNLWLATGDSKYADFLEYTFDTIEKYFPDYDESPFVQEKFFEDWSKDQTWGWQQNRAVVGHNLKIAWNLMRMNSLRQKESYVALAKKIADLMPPVGSDRQRGGWYDVVERVRQPGEESHRFVWHDRKAWWQQEQAILAYLILHGILGDEEYLKHAREAASFYNAFFLDNDDGAVYFNVLANGLPYLLGTERLKGSHSMSAYHSTELCYLAAVYTNLLITKKPLVLHFKPRPDGFADRVLRVSPDILPAGSVRIQAVEIDGKEHSDFDADALTVQLPESDVDLRVKVTLVPA